MDHTSAHMKAGTSAEAAPPPDTHPADAPSSVRTAGVLIGVGLGGFIDGIVLHQILQWHHLLSTTERYGGQTLADVRANVAADGAFHAVTWIAVAVGVALLWRTARAGMPARTWRTLLGWALVGWGGFNLVEGVIDHHILQIHRVRPDAGVPLAYDMGFLALGALLVIGGWLLQRSDAAAHQRQVPSGDS